MMVFFLPTGARARPAKRESRRSSRSPCAAARSAFHRRRGVASSAKTNRRVESFLPKLIDPSRLRPADAIVIDGGLGGGTTYRVVVWPKPFHRAAPVPPRGRGATMHVTLAFLCHTP